METLFQDFISDPIRLVLAGALLVAGIILFAKLTGALLKFVIEFLLLALIITVFFGNLEWVGFIFDFFVALFTGEIIEIKPLPGATTLPKLS